MMTAAQRLETVQEYYFSQKLREVRELIAKGNKVINMGIGSPDLAPSQAVIEAIQNAMFDPKAHEYQSYQGLPELREAMANFYLKHYNLTLNPANEILPLLGSKEGIMHISLAFLNPGDEVLIPNPGYPTYASVTELVQAKAVYYDLKGANGWQPDFEQLEQLDLSKVKIMWVCYPHMPTGAKALKGTFEKLIAFGKKHNILIVNDNPYSFILNDETTSILNVDGAMDTALELNSLSKSFNISGWRVGMVMGNAKLIEMVLKVKSNMDSGMFYGIQKGAIVALQSNQEWFDQMNAVYAERKAMVVKLLTQLGCTYDAKSVGLFVWAKLPSHLSDAKQFVDDLLYRYSIFITPGTIFGSNGEGYIRFSLCVSVPQIQEALQRVSN
jgi:LL-diaminopimelate aminotransferase